MGRGEPPPTMKGRLAPDRSLSPTLSHKGRGRVRAPSARTFIVSGMGRLFWKFFLAFWLALLTAGVGVGTTVWLRQRALDAGSGELEGGPRSTFLVQATASVLQHGGSESLRDLLEQWQRQPHGAHVYVVGDTGQEMLGRTVSPQALAQARRLAEEQREPRIAQLVSVGGRRYLFFVPSDGPGAPHGPPPSPLVPILAGLLASLAFSALLAWYLSTPVRHLRAAFDALAGGRLDIRVGQRMGRRRDEVTDLGRDFDRMAEQLQVLVGSQQRLLHDVSHELRSPLARLQAAIGLARQQPEKLDGSLDRIEQEAVRLDRLVGELLTLSRLEVGVDGETDEAIDLAYLVREVAEDARFEAEAPGRRVLLSGTRKAVVIGRAEVLHRALEDVSRNAVKFTREGTTVEIALTRLSKPERILVTVSDRGPGVPDGELETIFEPFVRSATHRQTAGFGLGLAIARRAIETHHGSIRALNRPEGGLRIEITLPVSSGRSSAIDSRRA